MSGLQITTTTVGRAALVNAEHNGTAPLTVTHIGLTATAFKPDQGMTVLPGEFKRLNTLSGGVVAPGTIHVTIRDDGTDTYTVRGIGYWLSNGVLLGVYSQPEPILQKSAQSMLLLSADTIFTTIDVTSLTFGNANFTNPPGTTSRQGVVELATFAETVAGSDHTRAVTPAGLTPALAAAIAHHKKETDPHPAYLTDERGDALYFRTLDAVTDSNTDCDTLLTTGVRDVLVANDRGILAATHLPMGGDGFGTLVTLRGKEFVRQVYTEGGITQRTWERTGFTAQKPLFKGRAWKLAWDTVTFDPATKQNLIGYAPARAAQSTHGIAVTDQRTLAEAPKERGMGVYFDFKNNDVDGLSDGGTAHGVITFRPYGSGSDFTGGPAHQLGFTSNGNPCYRLGGQDKWGSWKKLYHSGNLPEVTGKYLPLTGGNVGSLTVGGTGKRAVTQGQNGTLPDGGPPLVADMNAAPLGWATYTQEATANRPTPYGHVFTSSLNGSATPAKDNWLLQRAISTDNQIVTRVNINSKGWSAWSEAWTTRNLNPADKISGSASIRLNWNGRPGQPAWLHGGDSAGDCAVYSPVNFHVAYAHTAGLAAANGGTASYAHQLAGPGLQENSVGSYRLNKNHGSPEVGGAWQIRGWSYDHGTGNDGGIGTRTTLWQRVG
ncbi:hypothetical protein [Glaciimonas sp. PAMC28666]|uniref:hypothetical protein n=1 Tax=Glaciimonas sp. PAMC28666 TaxID=2807626 RepID=UPI0019626C8E|nr:hypothetical protein [Glaciimonas sp. PAMC28666]QRX80880.1 hypothetical protein JQN73_11640 [Glaciimonas sp. PAMC28666]QRX82302.1 hypothetical protein JQN73_19775 [Glaciimonas sp. PAMC28666]